MKKVFLTGDWTIWTNLGVQQSRGVVLVPTSGKDGGVFAVEAETGKIVWKAKIPDGAVGLAAVDVNADDVEDALVPSASGLYLLDGKTGKSVVVHSEPMLIGPSPILLDVNQDGMLDWGVAVGAEGKIRDFVLLNGDTQQTIWRFSQEHPIFATPALWDVNEDGVEDVLLVTGYGKAIALNGKTGEMLWGTTIDHRVDSAPIVGRISAGRQVGLGFGAYDRNFYMLDARTGAMLWKYLARAQVEHAAAFWDIDADGFPDAIFCDRLGWVYAVKGNTGTLLWNSLLHYKQCNTSPLVVDYNADGIPEVWAGDQQGWLYLMSGRGPVITSLHQFPIAPTISSTPVFLRTPAGKHILAVPAKEGGKTALFLHPLLPRFSPSALGWWKYRGDFRNAGFIPR